MAGIDQMERVAHMRMSDDPESFRIGKWEQLDLLLADKMETDFDVKFGDILYDTAYAVREAGWGVIRKEKPIFADQQFSLRIQDDTTLVPEAVYFFTKKDFVRAAAYVGMKHLLDNYDADTVNEIIQTMAFGEVVYG